jgi:hypothetical protein
MKFILTEAQMGKIQEQLTQSTGTTDFSEYVKKFESIRVGKNSFTPDDFLSRLNSSPIQLNMYHIQTDGYDIGTGSVSISGKVNDMNIRLNLKPVGDFKTGLVTITKTL